MRSQPRTEPGDEAFWGKPRGPVLPVSGSFVVDGLVAAVGFVVLFTIVGLVTLWPHGRLGHKGRLGPVRTLGAVAERIERVPCALSATHVCHVARVKLLDGPQKGQMTTLTTVESEGSLNIAAGDHIRVYKNNLPKGAPAGHLEPYSFADFDRRGAMLWLTVGFVALLLVTGRLHGLRALFGLVASMLIIVEFVVPAILHGSSPLAVAIVGSFAVMLVMMPVCYGLGAKAIAAWLRDCAEPSTGGRPRFRVRRCRTSERRLVR